jgi:hypothetical protein
MCCLYTSSKLGIKELLNKEQIGFKVGFNRTGHISFLNGQEWIPKFAGQVILKQSLGL